MKHLCTGCGVEYGRGENRPKFGFCPGCWALHLEETRRNARLMYVEHCKVTGTKPSWEAWQSNERVQTES